ncbi:MAG: hypothetical protein ACM3NV_00265 [Syntrophothermus sp.]
MRPTAATAIAVLAAGLALAACGGSSSSGAGEGAGSTSPKANGSSTGVGSAPAGASARACPIAVAGGSGLRVTGVSCAVGQRVALAWRRDPSCRPAAGASRGGCRVGGYLCLATATGRGLAVSCARPGRAIAFTVKD